MTATEVWCARPTPERATRVRRRRHGSLARRVFRGAFTLVAMAVTAAFVTLALLPTFGMRTMIVLSGSMVPMFHTGDAVVVADAEADEVQVGDVITFAGYGTDRLTTHRVISLHDVQGRLHFRTQGDANAEPDPNLAPAEGLQGEVRFVLPAMGRVLAPMRTQIGQLVILGLPAAALIVMQVRSLLRSRHARTHARHRTPQLAIAAAAVVVVALAGGVTVAHTLASFTDGEQVDGNRFETGTF